jgi:hypothetical protein
LDYRPGHYNRALEEAIQTHKGQWAKDWESKNPVSGQATFASMTPIQRVCVVFMVSEKHALYHVEASVGSSKIWIGR